MEDSFATPVSKLPPPVLSMRSDDAPVEATSYTDILNTMEKHQQPQQPQQHAMPHQQFNAMPQLPPMPNTPVAHHQQEYYLPPQQQQQQQQYYVQSTPPAAYMYDDQEIAPPPKQKAPHPIISTETLRERSLWLFAGIMFVAIIYGLPKLRQFPAFVNPVSGGLSTPASALASVGSGLAFTVATRFV